MNTIKTNFKLLTEGDIANISILIVLSIIELIYLKLIAIWYYLIPINILIIYIIYYLVYYYESAVSKVQINENKFSFLKIIRYWYAVPLILICFKETYLIINYIKPSDIDRVLISIDWNMFGVNPTQWAYRFANPFLTEFLQIIYLLYYVIIITYGLELYLWKRYSGYKYAMFMIVISFWISYLLYMIFPAVGPRFILHDFNSISKELPGIFFTEKIRAFLNFAESIPAGSLNPISFAQRDAMPSLHLTLAVLIAYLSYKIKSKSFYFYLPYCILMTLSTIYLRYHYLVDLIAGFIVFLIVVVIGKLVYRDERINSMDGRSQ